MTTALGHHKIAKILASADIHINGGRPWDIQVYDERVFARIISGGSIGLGEAFMDGWWNADELDVLFTKLLKSRIESHFKLNVPTIMLWLKSRFFNMQSRARSRDVVQKHYDLGNDLYMSFLDPYNQYTCGYFKDTNDLNIAQENKMELICRKLKLSAKDKVLDIGCGWGGFSKYAAEHYGCDVTGISISDEQINYARDYCKNLPVTILKKDYRALEGNYDKVLICGMIEHVGFKNYRTIMQKVHDVLAPDGLFLLHTIGSDLSHQSTDPWIGKYIFPNGMIPSVSQIASATEGLFVMEDWHNFGIYYVDTLKSWHNNFVKNWHQLSEKYGERFYRMWNYYLLSCAGYFNSRTGQLWQIVFSKDGIADGYISER